MISSARSCRQDYAEESYHPLRGPRCRELAIMSRARKGKVINCTYMIHDSNDFTRLWMSADSTGLHCSAKVSGFLVPSYLCSCSFSCKEVSRLSRPVNCLLLHFESLLQFRADQTDMWTSGLQSVLSSCGVPFARVRVTSLGT